MNCKWTDPKNKRERQHNDCWWATGHRGYPNFEPKGVVSGIEADIESCIKKWSGNNCFQPRFWIECAPINQTLLSNLTNIKPGGPYDLTKDRSDIPSQADMAAPHGAMGEGTITATEVIFNVAPDFNNISGQKSRENTDTCRSGTWEFKLKNNLISTMKGWRGICPPHYIFNPTDCGLDSKYYFSGLFYGDFAMIGIPELNFAIGTEDDKIKPTAIKNNIVTLERVLYLIWTKSIAVEGNVISTPDTSYADYPVFASYTLTFPIDCIKTENQANNLWQKKNRGQVPENVYKALINNYCFRKGSNGKFNYLTDKDNCQTKYCVLNAYKQDCEVSRLNRCINDIKNKCLKIENKPVNLEDCVNVETEMCENLYKDGRYCPTLKYKGDCNNVLTAYCNGLYNKYKDVTDKESLEEYFQQVKDICGCHMPDQFYKDEHEKLKKVLGNKLGKLVAADKACNPYCVSLHNTSDFFGQGCQQNINACIAELAPTIQSISLENSTDVNIASLVQKCFNEHELGTIDCKDQECQSGYKQIENRMCNNEIEDCSTVCCKKIDKPKPDPSKPKPDYDSQNIFQRHKIAIIILLVILSIIIISISIYFFIKK